MQLGLPFDCAPEPHIEFYFIRHGRARRYIVRVDPDGRVRVTIPPGGSRREADAFALAHLDWIRREWAKCPATALSPDDSRRLRDLARRELPARLMELAALHGLPAPRVSIRDQRSRWGSCGRDGHICLNWRLVQMPPHVRDYVLIHELMHLRRFDHSPRFWKLVAEACPGYEAARAWLLASGRDLC